MALCKLQTAQLMLLLSQDFRCNFRRFGCSQFFKGRRTFLTLVVTPDFSAITLEHYLHTAFFFHSYRDLLVNSPSLYDFRRLLLSQNNILRLIPAEFNFLSRPVFTNLFANTHLADCILHESMYDWGACIFRLVRLVPAGNIYIFVFVFPRNCVSQ